MTSVTQDAIPSTNEISTDSEDGGVQHIEDITHTTTAPGAVTGPTPNTTQQPISNTPHRHPILNTTSLPHPFRPSDRARLLAHEAAACRRPMIVRLQDIHSVALLLDPQVQRPCLRSRDSGYDADESSNVSEDGGNESDSSEEVRPDRQRVELRQCGEGRGQAAGTAAAAGGVRLRAGVQMVGLHEGTGQEDVASSSATVE